MENYTLVEHLNSINLKHYSETSVQTTTSVKRPMLSPPSKFPSNRYLLMRPATTFLTPKWKKTCLKQQLQNFIQRRNAEKHKEQFIKNKRLSDYIYSIANL